MPTAPTPTQSAASRANGTLARPRTPKGKARSAQNATRRELRGTAEPGIAARYACWPSGSRPAGVRTLLRIARTNPTAGAKRTRPADTERTRVGSCGSA